jgi:hypothetical protein
MRKNVHLAVSEMGRMTVLRRERPDAAQVIDRRHGLGARRPPRGIRLRHEAASRSRSLGVRVCALSAAAVWVMASRRLRHVCLFRELRSGEEYIVRAPLPLEAVARWQRGVNQWHRSRRFIDAAKPSCAYRGSACLAVSHWILALPGSLSLRHRSHALPRLDVMK